MMRARQGSGEKAPARRCHGAGHVSRPWSAVGFLLALAVAGCESRSREEAAIRQPASDESAGQGAHDRDTAQPAAGAAGTEVRVVLTEWKAALSADTVPAGRTTFRVVNQGTEEHSFEVESDERGIEWAGDELAPGGEQTLTVDLQPGTWEVYCPLATPSASGGHARRGMRSLLVVR
jgi:uncharacterized cupredoxin-like copper-binding protein